MTQRLLTRDQFREGVFHRDGNLCVNCGNIGQDAHHIMERRLFPDGGYYLSNGVTVCGPCHIQAEQTLLTPEELREKANISETLLPSHLYRDQRYDKWGNPILENGTRLQGELFEDESVQKVLSSVLHLFTNRVKYPRTWHLPESPGATSDDRVLSEEVIENWNYDVVITEKMDGENTNFYSDGLHARSIDYEPHPSRSKIKALHSQIAHNIPRSWRICCENLTAVHSLEYNKLTSICNVFGIWVGSKCLNWDDTMLYASLLNLEMVPIIYRGPFYRNLISNTIKNLNLLEQEGFVIRPVAEFHLRDFSTVVGKYVRKNHVQTHGHWMRSAIRFNKIN